MTVHLQIDLFDDTLSANTGCYRGGSNTGIAAFCNHTHLLPEAIFRKGKLTYLVADSSDVRNFVIVLRCQARAVNHHIGMQAQTCLMKEMLLSTTW